eukprot:1576473-Pyramimonas_sp.AAC.1
MPRQGGASAVTASSCEPKVARGQAAFGRLLPTLQLGLHWEHILGAFIGAKLGAFSVGTLH